MSYTATPNVSDFIQSADAAAMRTNLGSIATGLTGTLPFTNGGLGIATGASGGIPYFSGTTTMASSGALALNSIVIGGGPGNAPITTTTGAGVITAIANSTNGTGGFVVYGGTVNLNINGTVGGTTPAAGTFTTFTATGTSTIGQLVDPVDGVTPLNNAIAAYGTGTVYSLTNTSAAVDFGTTDPLVTIANAGTYMLFGRCVLKYNGATFVANRTVTLKIRRTNNTAADVASSTSTLTTGVVTTLTATFLECSFPPVKYTTGNTNDTVTIFADVDTVPSAGSLDISAASLVAERLY